MVEEYKINHEQLKIRNKREGAWVGISYALTNDECHGIHENIKNTPNNHTNMHDYGWCLRSSYDML